MSSKPFTTVLFGEIMMRLTTPDRLRFAQSQRLDVSYGGSEANVAISLACFGQQAAFVTRLPDNPFGNAAIASLRSFGVDTSHIVRGGSRIGLYFVELGASQRPSVVIYDRAGSAISEVGPGDFDWKSILSGAHWFHITGITPALGQRVAETVTEACQIAKSAGLTISCDLNYRSKLWSIAEAGETMAKLLGYVDLLVANEQQADNMFRIQANSSSGKTSSEAVARMLADRFHLATVALTGRESQSSDNNLWSATLLHQGDFFESPVYDVHIVDRIGGGDAFTAGLIYCLGLEKGGQEALNFAVAASCLKHSISGDFNLLSAAEVEQLMNGDQIGRVQR